MTDDLIDLDAIRARAEAATPGPWSRHDFGHAGEQEPSSIVVHTGRFDWDDLDDPDGTSAVAWMATWDSTEDANAEFIAHARTDVPALLDEVERLREAEKRVRKARLCEKHFWDVDGEVYVQDGCTLCYMNRAEKAEAERDRLRTELDEVGQRSADRMVENHRLRAAVDAVRALADGPPSDTVYVHAIRAALEGSDQ